MKTTKIVRGRIVYGGSFLGYVFKFILNIPLFIITFGAWYFYWNQKYFVNHLRIELELDVTPENGQN